MVTPQSIYSAMKSIFICHDDFDQGAAKRLESALWCRNIRVSRGIHSISPSANIPQAIGEAISICDLMVLVWSENAAASVKVTSEWNTAIALKKPIIPVYMGQEFPLPVALRAINGIREKDPEKISFRISEVLLIKANASPKALSPQKRVWQMLFLVGIVALMAGGSWFWTMGQKEPGKKKPFQIISEMGCQEDTVRPTSGGTTHQRFRKCITGTVSGDSSGGIAGVKVSLMQPYSETEASSTTTDASGWFEICLPKHTATELILEYADPLGRWQRKRQSYSKDQLVPFNVLLDKIYEN
jgi:hypothetical protein